MARLTAEQQAARNHAIFLDRARGYTWPTIAERHGVGVRRAQQIVKRMRKVQETEQTDAKDDIREAIIGLDAELEDYSKLADETTNDSVRLGALNSKLPVIRMRLELKRALRLLASQSQLDHAFFETPLGKAMLSGQARMKHVAPGDS